MSNNDKLIGIFLLCLIPMLTLQAKSKGYLGIASVSRDANSTNITFSDNRPSREVVRSNKTTSFGVSVLHSAGNFLGFLYSTFSGKPISRNYSESDREFYYNLPTSVSTSMTVAVVGLAAGSVISEMVLDRIGFPVTALNIFTMSATVVGIAGLTHTIYKLLYTEAEQGINIRPDGVTRFGYFKSKLGKERLEGEGTILWPNGIGYEGLFENDLIKNNPNGKLILFPEENEYNVEFSNTRIPEKENEKHTFTNVHYFKNTSYNRVNKLLRFADGDVFRGIPNENTEGIYIPMNGTVVRATLRDVLLRKKVDEKKALATKIDSDEPICEGTVDCGDPDHPGNVD